MEQQFIPRKLIVFLGLLIIIFNVYIAFVQFLRNDSVVVCNEQSGMTLIVLSKRHHAIVASEGSLKDILSCIGKSTPYYSRTIETFLSSNFQLKQELSERYNIKSQPVERQAVKIDFNNSLYFLTSKEQSIILGVQKTTTPFLIEKYLNDHRSIIVYMPENSPVIDEIMRKIVEDKGGEFHTLKIGEKAVNALF